MSAKQNGFGDSLRGLRKEANLSQEVLAKRAGLSARVISDIERGTIKTPQAKTMGRLADALKLRGSARSDFLAAPPPRKRPSRRPPQPPPRALPIPITRLVNRDDDISTVKAMLRRSDVRLVTLLGLVGVGKTRLSLAVAEGLQRVFADGIWFVDLAAVNDSARLAPAVAEQLGVRLAANRLPLEALADHLRERRVLLILDNLEQMDPGATIITLLQTTTRLKILATSRRALRVRGEQEFPVRPLVTPNPAALPEMEELARIESVALFVQCVRSDLPEFHLTPGNARAIAEICARLDGLPLSIELAASRVKAMSPAEMVPRLQSRLDLLADGDRDLPDRHRSLRAAIAWSCDQLSDEARLLFRRFAVFVGGASLDAVESGCSGGQDGRNDSVLSPGYPLGPSVLSLSPCPGPFGCPPLSAPNVWTAIRALQDASLLRREEGEDGEARFTVLPTIREWALEELGASGEEDLVRARHAAWAVAFAEEAQPRLFTVEGATWLNRFRREQDNLGAAMEWALGHDGDLAIRLANAWADVWYLRGQIVEGEDYLFRALNAAPDRNPARVKGLAWTANLTMVRGDHQTATTLCEEGLALGRELDDRPGIAMGQAVFGNILQHQRLYAPSFDLHHQALVAFTDLGDQAWMTNEICNLAWTSHGMGDDETAASYAEQLREIAAKTRDDYYRQVALLILGDLALAAGDPRTAEVRYQEVLATSLRHGDRWLAADALVGMAAVVDATGDPQRGARLLGAAEGLYRRLGVPFPPRDRPHYPAWLESIQGQLGEGVFAQAWSAGAALTLNEAADDAMTIAASFGSTPEADPPGR